MAAFLIFIVQFLMLIVQNTAFNVSLQNNISNVGGFCWLSSNLTCGENALCLDYTCVCELGSTPSISNAKNCDKVKCKSDNHCHQYFNNTKCDSNQTCSCEDSHPLDQETQTCRKPFIIGKQCSSFASSSDCDNVWTNAFCLKGRCGCLFGYTPASDLMSCKKVKCSADKNCAEFGNAQCTSGECKCKPNYQVDNSSQMCVRNKVAIGESCSTTNQCGNNSLCSQSTCKCLMGYTPTSDQMDCRKLKCSTNLDCADFGGAQCTSGECKCKRNYEVDFYSQKCESSKVNIGGYCSWPSQCGDNTLCLQYSCRCKMGFNATRADVNCEKVQCSEDRECETQFGNSECEYGECVCESGNSLDETTQKCVKNKAELNSYCYSSYDCGKNTYCSSSDRCKCLFGYKSSTKTDCERLSCTYDYQCSNLFSNSYCLGTYCSCSPLYQLENNTCKKTVIVDPTGLSVAVTVIVSLIPVFVVACCIGACCYCCCCRQPSQPQASPPLPRQVIVIDNPMRQRNIHYSTASAQMSAPNNAANQLYPELPPERPPPYNPDYYQPPQKNQ